MWLRKNLKLVIFFFEFIIKLDSKTKIDTYINKIFMEKHSYLYLF